jgi:hypothetical protein
MAEVTAERIKEAVDNIKSAFADGFQLQDLSVVVKEVTVFSEAFSLTGEEKKALAMQVASQVIDETDTPWLPDALTDPLLKKLLPSLIDLVVDASKGKLGLNAG